MEVESVVRAVFEEAWNDLEATGHSIAVEHMFFFRVENQRIVEVWELLDQDEFRRQLTGS
jgi:predicted ester cyclase